MIDMTLMEEAVTAAEAYTAPTDEQLKSVAFLGKKQQCLEAEVADLEKALDLRKKDLARVAELDLPDALAAIGMAHFKLDNGYEINVADDVYANIPSDSSDKPELMLRRHQCFQYLRNTGNEALIKHQILIEAGKGEDAMATEAKRALEEAGIEYTDTEAVHWQSLRAFVREQVIELQTPGFPKETFAVHVKKVATIKVPRKKTTK